MTINVTFVTRIGTENTMSNEKYKKLQSQELEELKEKIFTARQKKGEHIIHCTAEFLSTMLEVPKSEAQKILEQKGDNLGNGWYAIKIIYEKKT